VCADCAVEAGGAALCNGCATRDHDLASLRSEGVEARLMLRRAGVRVRRVAGDPLIVRSGGVPVAFVVIVLTATLTATVAVLLAGAAESWGVSVALLGIVAAAVLGSGVRLLFGGTSTTAGVLAALLALTAITLGSSLAQLDVATSGVVVAWRHLPGPPQLDRATFAACYVLAAALAYRRAAGRRVR
jgi:hypothetical protein